MGRKALVVGQGCLPQTPPHDTSLAGLPTPPRELGGVFLWAAKSRGYGLKYSSRFAFPRESGQILTIIAIGVDYATCYTDSVGMFIELLWVGYLLAFSEG
jgi:hypothetical protein